MTEQNAKKTDVCVIGAGTMGHGIAQVFASGGHPVRLFDRTLDILETAKQKIRQSLIVFRDFGLMENGRIDECLDRIELYDDLHQACHGVNLVVEAATEDLAFKQDLFRRVEALAPDECILCSNTSALSITDIGSCLREPVRFLGTHFWNPAQIVPCVEIIKGRLTSDQVFEKVVQLMLDVGKEPVRVLKDIPGFLGNRLQHALQREAMHLVEQGVAEPEEIDRVVKMGFGMRLALMGPFERADLGGLDTTWSVQKYLLPYLDNRKTASYLLEEKNQAGDLGLKTGRGFYDWSEESRRKMAEERDELLLSLIRLVKERR